jgi:hypothetical protein
VLVELSRLDAYRAEHPDTKLKASGFYYRIGFNMGFVALATEAALIEQVNQAIADMTAKNELPALAQAAGATYLAPHQPDILEHIKLVDLYEK